jgi:hypothetical protein
VSTVVANLDPSQYVKVSNGETALVLQSHRDTVRIAFGHVKPAKGNTAYHELGGAGKESMLPVPYTREPVWALAMTNRSSLSITGFPSQQTLLADSAGRRSTISQAGEMLTGQRSDDVNVNFQYGISAFDVVNINDVTGTGVIGTSGSLATLSTGTGVGSARLDSIDSVRYIGGHESYCSPSVVFASPEENVNQYIGFGNGSDMWCLGYQGLTPGLWFVKGGSATFIPQTEWNIDTLGAGSLNPSGYTVDLQTGQVPQLKYVWHGLRNMTVEMVLDNGNSVPCHKLNFINSATDVHLNNPTLPVMAKIERVSGTGANLTLKTGSWQAGIIGTPNAKNNADRWFAHSQLDFSIPAVAANYNIFTLRNELTFNGKTNHITAELGVVDFVNDCNKSLVVYGIYDATLSGNDPFTSISTGESIMSVSSGGTYSSGRAGPAAPVSKGAQRTREVLNTGINIHPGETFTFGVPTGGTASGTFTIVERHVEYR